MMGTLRGRDFLSVCDLTSREAFQTLELAAQVKKTPGDFARALAGQVVVLLFEKPSLRTRVTFETGMMTLGGSVVSLAHDMVRMGEREPVRDVARNLERWVQAVVSRTFKHSTLQELADGASIPIVNALSDLEHPCQAFADFQTIRESFGDSKVTIAYVGDGNNVCHSLMLLGAMLGYEVRVAAPDGYQPNDEIAQRAEKIGKESGSVIRIGSDPREMADGAHVLYTDVWTSMGQEEETKERLAAFQGYQIDSDLVGAASRDVRILHCLPAHRGEEITDEVIESPASVVFDQAENRLHSQKALLLEILAEG
jgi:ornithine carbamoyltransferase